jgi:hypothetical protein
MIDFVSAEYKTLEIDHISNILRMDARFEFTETSRETSRSMNFRDPLTNLKIELIDWFNCEVKCVRLKGSLHKFIKSNNYCDFNRYELEDGLNGICNWLGTKPSDWQIHSVEFGVNIQFDPCLILPNTVNYNGCEPTKVDYKHKGYLRKFELNQHCLKLYDKGKQYSLDHNLLRYEVKATKVDYFGKGFHLTLADLCSPNFNTLMRDKLELSLDRLIVTQQLVKKELSIRERQLYDFGRNPLDWSSFRIGSPNRNSFARRRKRFQNLIDSKVDVVSKFKKVVLSKWDELSLVEKRPLSSISQKVNSDTHLWGQKSTKRCQVCGADISNQDSRSKYCSERLKGSRKCRDKAANFFKHERRYYPQWTLFAVEDFIKPDYRNLVACELYSKSLII